MTIADQLISISNTKAAIKSAIEAKGVTVGGVAFDQYPSKISAITTGSGGGSSTPAPWVRPADWLTLPTVLSTEQKFVGLFAIFDNQSNTASFRISGTGYTVDWGDGSAPENYASAAVASHTYNYATISDTTLSSRGYKQAIITVVPQGAGNITGTDFSSGAGGNSINSGTYRVMNWLEMIMSFPSAGTSLVIGSGSTVYFPLCERVDIKSTSPTGISAANLFFNFFSLQEITTAFKFATGSTGLGTFRNCRSLRYLPDFDFSPITGNTYSTMFAMCSALESVPDTFPTSIPTTVILTSVFDSCDSLKAIPPSIGNIRASNMDYAFRGCRSIKTLPPLNTASCISFQYAFSGCNNLEYASIDFSNATTANNCFADCVSLREAVISNSTKVTNFSSLFSNCFNLEKVNAFSCIATTSASSIFANCYSLVEVPNLNWSSITSITTPFSTCYNLAIILITPPAATFSVGACRLSATELNLLYSNLPVSTGKTITVGGNWGITGDDPTIATAKGWTVTGS